MADLTPSLKVVHLGRLCKRSSEKLVDSLKNEYHSRWSVLAYGIFCYFTTCDKAKAFLETLPLSKPNVNLTRDQHRVKCSNICMYDDDDDDIILILDGIQIKHSWQRYAAWIYEDTGSKWKCSLIIACG